MGPIWTGFCENKKKQWEPSWTFRGELGGGFKDFLCSPRKLGKIPMLTNVFQRGWKPPISGVFLRIEVSQEWQVIRIKSLQDLLKKNPLDGQKPQAIHSCKSYI